MSYLKTGVLVVRIAILRPHLFSVVLSQVSSAQHIVFFSTFSLLSFSDHDSFVSFVKLVTWDVFKKKRAEVCLKSDYLLLSVICSQHDFYLIRVSKSVGPISML